MTTKMESVSKTSRRSQSARFLTPLQLAELKKGSKTNVVIGPENDHFIGLEGASVNVLAHFSPYAKTKLVEERAVILYIPNGTKESVRWIYKYMLSGESDPVGLETFESLTLKNLVQLYTHAVFLQYGSLMTRVLRSLKGKFYDSLPGVNDIKTFAVFVPPLFDYAIGILAHEMVNPWTCNYSAYAEYAAIDETFRVKLEKAIQDLVVHRVKVGTEYYQHASNRHVQWSQEYYDRVKTTKQGKKKFTVKLPAAADTKDNTTPVMEKKRRGRRPNVKREVKPTNVSETHGQNIHAAKKKGMDKDFKCYNCDKAGHLARDCKTKADIGSKHTKRPAPICYNCNNEGHLSRDCTVQRPAPICYNCDTEGHLARDCTESRKVKPREHIANTSTHRDTTGRNRNFRRAQRERIPYGIEVTRNGEGLRTCDREVRKGEMTRTGLVI